MHNKWDQIRVTSQEPSLGQKYTNVIKNCMRPGTFLWPIRKYLILIGLYNLIALTFPPIIFINRKVICSIILVNINQLILLFIIHESFNYKTWFKMIGPYRFAKWSASKLSSNSLKKTRMKTSISSKAL